MKQKRYLSLITRVLILSLPVLIVIGFYVAKDPFKVLYKHQPYYESGKPQYVTLNKDFVGVETFLRNNPTYHYDSYILGNSRSVYYHADYFGKHVKSDNCIHMDGASESLYGVSKKFEFFKEKNAEVKNALIILDYELLSKTKDDNGHIFMKHPALSGQNYVSFQLEFLKTFFSRQFLKAYVDFTLSHQVKDYMKGGFLIDDVPVSYNDKYNEIRMQDFDDMISKDPALYYTPKRMEVFYQRDTTRQTVSPAIVGEVQEQMLKTIKTIADEKKTVLKIVVNPLYDQKKLNPADLKKMQDIFGPDVVYDFSGINSITNNYLNYYEKSHYRPHIANLIMDSVYSNKQNSVLGLQTTTPANSLAQKK